MNLDEEAKQGTKLLQGKIVAKVIRTRIGEVGIEFTDGTRIFIDHKPEGLEISITGGNDE
jgi:hypothetical protein